jgi:mono/diheme cytochrome c family protein
MDRGGTVVRLLRIAAPALLLAAAAGPPTLPIAEARWLAPGALYEGLARQPRECFAPPADPAERRAARIGRIAFRAPLLLGGQAARAGLSCASCHRNGRGNPFFLFPGLSGAPGTADVTSSVMSRRRGDGRVNPVPIPDLAAPAAALKVARDRESRALETFIRGLVVEEFDGPEPPAAALAGLAAYVRAIAPCRGGGGPVTLRGRLGEVEEALALAEGSDPDTFRLLVAAARSGLGAIEERFRRPGLERERALLREAARELGEVRDGSLGLAEWRRRWPERRRRTLAGERRSLFDPAVLRKSTAAD